LYLTKSESTATQQTSLAFREALLPTKGFVQLGQDVAAIIGSAYPGFGFGGRNSAGHLLVNFGF
jgi:hypothetical protein